MTTEDNGGVDQGADEESRAFVVVRHGDRTWVVDLAAGVTSSVGRSTDGAVCIASDDVEPIHATLLWDGRRVSLPKANGPFFHNGKRAEAPVELKPGDELGVGPAQIVLGVAVPPTAGGRRALTHHEFLERLWEELARASRGGRETSLVMLQARPGDGGQVAATALDIFRAGDLVGTYAHDELELLLPDTPGDTARSVVERLLATAGVQASAGLAVAPADGESPERLLRAARTALTRADHEDKGIARPPPRPPSRVQPITKDPATRELVAALEKVAPGDGSVLLTGEQSSGKGVFGRLVHERSQRSNGPFVVVACSGLRTAEDGEAAFGADGSAVGRARGGTVFLDEVGDLPEGLQQRLLDALEREGNRLRVISSTHRALAGLVERGAFNAALHGKLSTQVREVPALRNRPDDIIPLAERFAEEFGATPPIAFSPGAIARLRSYPWPGNVLELRNAMERAVHLANGEEILAEHLPSETLPVAKADGGLREHVDSVERDAIVKALADSNHNQTHAARRLGISRRALIYKMEKYGLKRPPGARGRPRM